MGTDTGKHHPATFQESAIYVGQVRHRRYTPKEHSFTYPVYYLYLDIDQPDALAGKSRLWSVKDYGPTGMRPQPVELSLASWHRQDHLGSPQIPLRISLDKLMRRELRRPLAGRVNLLTQGRFLGFGFNPVSFFYCWNADGSALDAIVAEVSNTPWREKYYHVLDISGGPKSAPGLQGNGQKGNGQKGDGTAHARFEFDKEFHVSPFLDMDYHYKWRFSHPGKRLSVHMENWRPARSAPKFREGSEGEESDRGNGLAFDATLTLSRRPLTSESLNEVFWSLPLMSWRVVAGIYMEASRLWLKGVKFHDHPAPQPGVLKSIPRSNSAVAM